jgi:hypothetical protein
MPGAVPPMPRQPLAHRLVHPDGLVRALLPIVALFAVLAAFQQWNAIGILLIMLGIMVAFWVIQIRRRGGTLPAGRWLTPPALAIVAGVLIVALTQSG